MFRPNNLVAAALVALLFAGCSQQQQESPYVARVGTATLTEEDIASLGGPGQEQLRRQYISNWVTSELLFQEAQRRGFSESDEVQRQIKEATRRLAINAYLEREIYRNDSIQIDDATLRQELASNPNAYRLSEDVVRMSFAIFDERDGANAFRSKVLRGADWEDALQGVRDDDEAQQHLLRTATREFFSQATLFPEELWKIARTLSKEDISYVVRTNAGYCVAVVHSIGRQGEIPEYDYAREKIRLHLQLRQRNARYGELLERLRSQNKVEVRLAPGDSATERSEE